MGKETSLYTSIKRILRPRRRLRHLQNKVKAWLGKSFGKTAIMRDLRKLGIGPGDTVLLHSSLSRLGMVDGGPAAVVGAIQELLGSEGTFAVSTIHLKQPAVEHFQANPVFHPIESASTMGAISETARKLPGARRSVHPTHSVAVVGRHADYLTRDHHTSDRPFGPSSPYYRLAELKGKIILLGVPLANLTNFHVVEDILGDDFPYPVYMPDPVSARVVGTDGKESQMATRIHNPAMSAERRCNELEDVLLSRQVIRIGMVGAARTTIVDAAALNDALIDLLKSGVSMYTPDGNPLTGY